MSAVNDLTGKRYERLKVQRRADPPSNAAGRAMWRVLCDPERGGCGADRHAAAEVTAAGTEPGGWDVSTAVETETPASDEDAFHAALDARPGDHTTRLVFADWLEEHGDPRAEGYRAMGEAGVSPTAIGTGWNGTYRAEYWAYDGGSCYPRSKPWRDLVEAAATGPRILQRGVTFATRRDAEDAAALAFAALPPERRAEILAAVALAGA